MDHLPSSENLKEAYPRVPYLCIEDYDGLPFAEYHIRRGWNVQSLYSGDFTQHGPAETASFLQAWLFFGSLNEIFGYQAPFDMKQFILEDSEGRRVCTSSLNNHIAVWAARMEALCAESQIDGRAALTRIGLCLNTIHKICNSLSSALDSPLPPDVTLSLSVLGCTIDHALRWYWGLGRGRNWDLNTAAAIKMIESGWCPRDIAVASSTLTEIPMFCTSYMARPSTPNVHWNCTQSSCEVNQIDERAYVPKHRTPACQCGHVQPKQNDIHKILDKGGIPVICLTPNLQPDGTTKFDIDVKSGGLMIHSFLAISHVWSDGLGNPHLNSLASCQVEHLYDLLVDTICDETYEAIGTMGDDFHYNNDFEKKAVESVGRSAKRLLPGLKRIVNPIREFRGKPLCIWIDTLCVPLEQRYRKIAIARMQDVYARAIFTIVFDSELQNLNYRSCSPEEILTRVGLSGWFRRAWTFQEGVLANLRIRVLFADGIFKLPLGLDHNETVELQYVAPKFTSTMQSFQGRIANFADRHGVERPPITKVEKSRLEELTESRKYFTLQKHMLNDAEKFFVGMKTAWMLGNGGIKPSDQVLRITAIWEALRWRASSREDDKFICFAVSCTNGYKDRAQILELLSQPAEQRMKAWIKLQNVVPAGFLFLAGPRYEDHGFQWAPKGVHRELLEDTSAAERNPGTGELLFRKPGFILSAADEIGQQFQISDVTTSLRYSVTLDQKVLCAKVVSVLRKYESLAVVVMQMVGQRVPEYETYREAGALLGNLRRVDKKLYGEFVCRVEVCLIDDPKDDASVIPARPMDDDQAWVIS